MYLAWRLMHRPCQVWLLLTKLGCTPLFHLRRDLQHFPPLYKALFPARALNWTVQCTECALNNTTSPCEVANASAQSNSWHVTFYWGAKGIMKLKAVDTLLHNSMWKQLWKHLKEQQHVYCLEQRLFIFSLCRPSPWRIIRCYWTILY